MKKIIFQVSDKLYNEFKQYCRKYNLSMTEVLDLSIMRLVYKDENVGGKTK